MTATITAVFRAAGRVIRVWQGFGQAEDLTIAEAQALCRAGDVALVNQWGARDGLCALDFPDSPDLSSFDSTMIVRCDWLVALLAVVRRALRAVEAAESGCQGARQLGGATIDDAARGGSPAGSWARALRHAGGAA